MKTEVLIIGGGVAGLAMALTLGQRGVPVLIIEVFDLNKKPETLHFGRTAALMGNSVTLLQDLNLWDEIEAITAPLKQMRIIDDGNPKIDPVIVDFKAEEIGQEYFGHNVPNMMLQTMLLDAVQNCAAIEIICPDKLEKYEVTPSNIIATLESGKTITANIMIGADGKKSKTRDLANIKAKENKYGQSAITCLFYHSKSHANISTEHHRAGGPFTTVPMPDQGGQHCSSLVWVETTKDADNYIALDKSSFEHAIQKRSRNALGEITLASNPESWPLTAVLSEHFTAPRIALIAEAAHAMSPIGAQGLNLSLRDVSSLSDIILNALRLGEDIGSVSVLKRYEDSRRLDINSRFEGVDKYNRLVSNNIKVLRLFRRAGLKSLSTLPALKQVAMKQGLAA